MCYTHVGALGRTHIRACMFGAESTHTHTLSDALFRLITVLHKSLRMCVCLERTMQTDGCGVQHKCARGPKQFIEMIARSYKVQIRCVCALDRKQARIHCTRERVTRQIACECVHWSTTMGPHLNGLENDICINYMSGQHKLRTSSVIVQRSAKFRQICFVS